MHIAIDARLLTRGSTTGIPGYTRDLITALLEADKNLTITLLYTGVRRAKLPDSWLVSKRVHSISLAVSNRLLNLFFRLFNWPNIEQLSRLFKVPQPDLIFSPHFNLLPKSKTPRVITFHDLSFLHYPDFFSPAQKTWHKLQRYEVQAKDATALVAVSEFTRQDVIKLLSINSDKVHAIYSGITPSMHEYEVERRGELLVYKEERKLPNPFILHLGSIEPRKNIPLLIAAFEELKKDPRFTAYELIIAGRAGFKSSKIHRLIRRSPVSKSIRIISDLKDEERSLLYASSRIVVFPSFFEGFGFPPLEAQACGTPVITTSRSSLPEILTDSALYVDAWDASALARAIELLETNTSLRSGMISKGRRNAQRFSWNRTAHLMLELFEKILNEQRTHAATKGSRP